MYRVRHKFVQNLKISNKKRNPRKKFLFAPMWSEEHWIFSIKKVTEGGRLRVILRRFVQIRLLIKYLAGNISIIRIRQHVFITRPDISG